MVIYLSFAMISIHYGERVEEKSSYSLQFHKTLDKKINTKAQFPNITFLHMCSSLVSKITLSQAYVVVQ